MFPLRLITKLSSSDLHDNFVFEWLIVNEYSVVQQYDVVSKFIVRKSAHLQIDCISSKLEHVNILNISSKILTTVHS